MDALQVEPGDNNNCPRFVQVDEPNKDDISIIHSENKNDEFITKEITPQTIDDNELKLKDRIAQCRNIIEALKLELVNEKSKLEKESVMQQEHPEANPMSEYQKLNVHTDVVGDVYPCNAYSACMDSKLNCDDSLIAYEKQLQRYQNTLNMAQREKKNAIRKQMLTKAYRLKLLEVENQCNIELLRVKQSLQCLEPLKIIASKWKTAKIDSEYDLDNYELIPRFPELNANSGSDVNSYREDFECKAPPENSGICGKEDSSSSEC